MIGDGGIRDDYVMIGDVRITVCASRGTEKSTGGSADHHALTEGRDREEDDKRHPNPYGQAGKALTRLFLGLRSW